MLEDNTISNIQENSTFIDITTISTIPRIFVSVETQTILKSTSDASTQTTYDVYNSIQTYASISDSHAKDVVTDEDIIKYLIQKKHKEL